MGFKRFQWDPKCCKDFPKVVKEVTWFHWVKMVFNGFKELRCVSSAFKLFKRNSNGFKGLEMFSKELRVGCEGVSRGFK